MLKACPWNSQCLARQKTGAFVCSDASNDNLVYLSSEQALADISNFIVNVTDKYNLHGRKWIVFGGSYSGIY